MASKVMVTGAQGWLGRTLIRRLASENRRIVYVDKWKTKPALPAYLKSCRNIEYVNGDIRKPQEFAKKFENCETVFNCAAVQHPVFTADYYSVNVNGPANLLRMCDKFNVPRFIHISSSAVHGENINSEVPITEEDPLKPLTHCTISKAHGEMLLSSLSRGIKTRISIIRPGVFYGNNPSKNFIQLIKSIKSGAAAVFGRDGCLRTYADIEKVAGAILLAEKKGKRGEAYLIGDKEPLSTVRLYEIIAGAMNTRLKIIQIPKAVSRMNEKISLAAGKLNIHLRLPNFIGEVGRHHFFSSEKAIKELSYNPRKSSEEGIREMVRSVWQKS